MAARNDFHWFGIHRVRQSVGSRSSFLQSQFIAKDLRPLVLALVLALCPGLDCDFRRPLFQSSDIQTHRE